MRRLVQASLGIEMAQQQVLGAGSSHLHFLLSAPLHPCICLPWPGVTEARVPFLTHSNPSHSAISPPCLLRPLQAPLLWKSLPAASVHDPSNCSL